jgi:uncharacterized protein
MNQEVVNQEVLKRYVAALQSGDPLAVREFFAEDASWTLHAGQLPMSGAWLGRDRIMDGFFATAMSLYEPGSVEIEVTAMIAQDDHVVLQWTSRAETRDGRPYENGCIGVFTIRDGRITAVREYMDTLYVSDAFARVSRATSSVGTGV